MSADWHGLRRGYRRDADGAEGKTLRSVRTTPLRLDPRGVEQAWGLMAIEPEWTVLAGVRRMVRAAPPAEMQAPAPPGEWGEVFEAAVERLIATAEAPVLALGGGLDAAAVLSAWRRTGAPLPAVLTLATGLDGYDEVEEAAALAAALGARCEVVRVTPDALVDVLPQAIAAVETPLYNLHPVSRFLLARATRARGHRTLITGDGADAVFAGRPDLDYVPLVATLTEAAGMVLGSPFLAEPVVTATRARGADPDKHRLRAYLRDHGLAERWTAQPKRPRWLPPQELTRHRTAAQLERLGRELGQTPRLRSDRDAVSWTTLALLHRWLEGDA